MLLTSQHTATDHDRISGGTFLSLLLLLLLHGSELKRPFWSRAHNCSFFFFLHLVSSFWVMFHLVPPFIREEQIPPETRPEFSEDQSILVLAKLTSMRKDLLRVVTQEDPSLWLGDWGRGMRVLAFLRCVDEFPTVNCEWKGMWL